MTTRKKNAIFEHIRLFPECSYITMAKIYHTTPESINRVINERVKHDRANFSFELTKDLKDTQEMLIDYKARLIDCYENFEWNTIMSSAGKWHKTIPDEINRINNRLQAIEAVIVNNYINDK